MNLANKAQGLKMFTCNECMRWGAVCAMPVMCQIAILQIVNCTDTHRCTYTIMNDNSEPIVEKYKKREACCNSL